MKRILILSIVLIAAISSFSQNLEKMKKEQREVLLVEIAKNAIKKYAPDYYREFRTPKITRSLVKDPELVDEEYGVRLGRVIYKVAFPYDISNSEEHIYYSVDVLIWGDTGTLYIIGIGNGIARAFKENMTRSQEKEVEKIPYMKHKPRPTMFPQ
ncbi:type II secretion system protein [Bacteroides sp. 224]|uniref:type II secretion system protein n=1 Tax=Bacteroides sp. 224 TaxID=2302936 RepID=UPI0013D8B742|nr:type II secretion system protein [Bacteroides sp. 224]NDV64580.1 type II secretion system protein [Bacteroides sp. 224]